MNHPYITAAFRQTIYLTICLDFFLFREETVSFLPETPPFIQKCYIESAILWSDTLSQNINGGSIVVDMPSLIAEDPVVRRLCLWDSESYRFTWKKKNHYFIE